MNLVLSRIYRPLEKAILEENIVAKVLLDLPGTSPASNLEKKVPFRRPILRSLLKMVFVSYISIYAGSPQNSKIAMSWCLSTALLLTQFSISFGIHLHCIVLARLR